ncbi:hypothetical protein T492DRAFT_885115 [Pavlovales sp. CCMP2436]|nr:hypothetical protein T492DRAFT_885115 [Pavlovales sp. CCMP2436]
MYTVLRPYARKFANAYAQEAELHAVRVIDSADVTNLVVRSKAVLSNNACTTNATADGTEAVAYFNHATLTNRATPDGSSDAVSTGTYTIPVLSYPLNPFDYTFGMKGCVVTIGDPNIPATPTATIQRAYAVCMGYDTANQSLVPAYAYVILQAFGPGAMITVVLEALEPVCYVGLVLAQRLVFTQPGQRQNWPLTQLYAPGKVGVPCRLGAVPASTRGSNTTNMRPCMFNQLRVRTTSKSGARLTPMLVFASEHASRLAPNVLLGGKAEMGGDLVVRGAATFGTEVLFSGRTEMKDTLFVQGDATFDAGMQVTGALVFSGPTTIMGPADSMGTMLMRGASTFIGNVEMMGDLLVRGAAFLPALTYLNGVLMKPPASSIAITGCTAASDSWLVQTDNTGSEFQVQATAAFNPFTVGNADALAEPTSLSTFKLVLTDPQGTPVSPAGIAQNWDVNLCLTKGGKVANSGLYRFAPGASGSLGVTIEEYIGFMGGGTPTKCAAILATAATAICYATKTPAVFFTEKGSIKQFHPDPEGSDEPENKTQLHFVIVPILAACVGYLLL